MNHEDGQWYQHLPVSRQVEWNIARVYSVFNAGTGPSHQIWTRIVLRPLSILTPWVYKLHISGNRNWDSIYLYISVKKVNQIHTHKNS